MTQPPLAGLPPEARRLRGGEGRPGGSLKAEGTEGSGVGGAEGCGEISATGGGRGQLPELGSGVASRAGWVTNEPRVAHTQYYTDAGRGGSLGNHSLQKSGLQTAETSAESPHHRRRSVTPPKTEAVNQ